MAKEKSRHPWHLAEPPTEELGGERLAPLWETGLTSRELVRKYRRGEPESAQQIADRYTRRLVALARRQLAPRLSARLDPEDVVQSAFRSFFVKAGAGAYVFERAGDLWRLLAQITVNKAKAHAGFHSAAKRDVRKEMSADDLDAIRIEREPTPEEAAMLSELMGQLMESLDPLARRVLELALRGASLFEIANDVNRAQRTVRWILSGIKSILLKAQQSQLDI